MMSKTNISRQAAYAQLAGGSSRDQPRTVVGVLLNYTQTLVQLAPVMDQPPYKAAPKAPVLYIKPANTYAAEGDDIVVPTDVDEVEIGACIGVVFDRKVTRVDAAQALDHVAGFRIVADLTVPHTEYFRPAIKQRCRDGFCPIGSNITPRAAVNDFASLVIEVYVDGQMVQQAYTRDLVRPVAQLISDVSQFMTFDTGDVLLIGLPAHAPRVRAGQRYEIRIDPLGSLSNRLIAAVD